MIAEALGWLEEHSKQNVTNVGGKSFAVEEFTEIKPDPDPQVAAMALFTLGGLVDWVKQTKPENSLIRVTSPSLVELLLVGCDQWGRRQLLATATKSPYQGFKFNSYLDHEDFCIALQQHFVPVNTNKDDGVAGEGAMSGLNDFDYVAQVSANITSEAITTSENDGISQKVGIKRGLKSGLQDLKSLRRVVTLAPFRTFTEVPQPESPFIFRAKDAGAVAIPLLALFECDGGRWQTQAMESIKKFLDDEKTGVPVIA